MEEKQLKTATRPGVKTTEFWGVCLFVITIVANGTSFINIPDEHITLLLALIGAYGGGRFFLKKDMLKESKDEKTDSPKPSVGP